MRLADIDFDDNDVPDKGYFYEAIEKTFDVIDDNYSSTDWKYIADMVDENIHKKCLTKKIKNNTGIISNRHITLEIIDDVKLEELEGIFPTGIKVKLHTMHEYGEEAECVGTVKNIIHFVPSQDKKQNDYFQG